MSRVRNGDGDNDRKPVATLHSIVPMDREKRFYFLVTVSKYLARSNLREKGSFWLLGLRRDKGPTRWLNGQRGLLPSLMT